MAATEQSHPFGLQVSLGQAAAGLQARRMPSAGQALTALDRLKVDAQMAAVLRHLNLAAFENEQKRFTMNELLTCSELTGLEAATVKALQDIFPVRSDYLEERLINWEGGDLFIDIEPIGAQITLDDLSGMMMEGADRRYSMVVFLQALQAGSMVIDVELWWRASAHFDWGLEVEFIPNLWGDGRRFDRARLDTMLEARGLECFKTAIDVAWCETGNIWLDYNPYSDEEIEQPELEFSIETVERLRDEYIHATALLSDYKAAEAMVESDPSLISEMFEMFMQSVLVEGDTRRKGRTLMEIFAEEAAEAAAEDMEMEDAD